MGILIGKADSVLQDFCIANQLVEQNQFKTKQRSINKSLQSYSWREKASIKYDLDFLTESDYCDIEFLLNNKSNLHEGFITMPIPYSDNKTKCIYTFQGVANPSSTNIAKKYIGSKGVNSFNPITETLTYDELTTANYEKIDSYDTNGVSISNAGHGVWLTLNYDISNFLTTFSYKEIKRFTLVFFGMQSSPINFYLWDYVNSAWYNIDDFYFYDASQFASPDFYLNYQMVAPFSLPYGYESINANFINANRIMFGVHSTSLTQNLMVQYVKLFINGYNVISNDPDSFDYRDYFTGMGRKGQLNLSEI